MSIEVEIRLFPGLPNPRFVLSRPAEAEFRDRLSSLPSPPVQRLAVPGMPLTISGYQGLFLKLINDAGDLEERLLVFAEEVTSGLRSQLDPDRQLERSLFEMTPPLLKSRIPYEFDDLIQTGPAENAIEGVQAFGRPPECEGALPFPPPPTIWHERANDNNCYNYALNLPCHNWASPGGLSYPVPCRPLVALVESDGPRQLHRGFENECAANAHMILLCVVNPHKSIGNFHFLRLDRDGVWSHKFGGGAVENEDHNESRMTDLGAARFTYRLVACAVFEYVRDRPCGISLY